MSKQLFFFNALNVFFTLLLRNLLLTSAVLLFPGTTAEATVFRIPNVARNWNTGVAEWLPFPVTSKKTYILPVKLLDTSNTANTDTVNVTHDLSADASLTNLTISRGTLSPSFSSILINYTATVTDIKRNHIIYTMGDSITAFDEYQSALSSLLNNVFTIVNLGLGSDITNNMIKRFPEVTNGSGEYVIIMAGVNDIKNGVSSSGVEKNLQTMYHLAHNAGLKVIALTVTPFKGYGKWTSKAQSVEDEVNAWIPGAANVDYVIDTYSVLVDPGNPNQMLPLYDRGDHLHPNLKGEIKIAEAIYSKAMFNPNLTFDLNNATIQVTPTTANVAAKVTVNGDGLISGSVSVSKSLPLNMGENIIKTVVTAQDGLTTRTYNLNVKRTLSSDADLANIVLKSGNLYPSFAASTTNYTAFASNSTASLTVMPVTLDSGSKIAINGTRVLSEQGSLSISLVAGPNAISIKVTAPDGISTKTYNLTIIRTLNNPVITFPVLPVKNYGDPDFIIAATSSDTQIPISYTSDNVKVATIIGNNVHITGAGTVNITAAQLVDTNYTVEVGVSRSLTVNKVSRTLTFNEIRTQIYGDEDFDANATASSGEAVIYKDYNPSTINIVNGKIHIVGAGTTSITATLDSNTNYDNIPVQSRTLTVNKHILNVIANNQIKKYGDDNLPFIISYKGFVNGDDVTTLTSQSIASTNATALSPIGKYDITPMGAGSNNYTFNYVKGILAIIPATRTLLFSTIENITYGDADFAAGATASSGEPVIYNDYDRSLINIVNGQVHIIGAGITSITATVAPDSNYTDIPFQNQVLNINKANQTITFKDIPRQLVGTSYGLETIATASSGLPVKFVSSNPDIATLYGSDLKLSHLGKISVTALQDGDFNYKPALSVTVPLEITDADGDEVRIRPMLSPNGDGINDFLEIDGIRSYPDNTVTIISRSGEIIYEAKGYNNSTQAFDGHSGKTGALQIAGTYFYLIKYTSNGQIRRKTGFLELRY